MSGKRIVFIEPKPPEKHVFSAVKMPRLGPVIMGTLAKRREWEVSIQCEDIHPIDWTEIERADLVGISTLTSSIPRTYNLIKKIKQLTDALIIIGGPHVSFCDEEALRHGAGIVVRGEGESTFLEILRAVENGKRKSLSSVAGISYLANDVLVRNPVRSFLTSDELNKLPLPDFSIVRGWERKEQLMVYPFQLSRGCPNECTFCSVIQMFGRQFRGPSVERCVDIWENAAEVAHSTMFVADDNLIGNPKRAERILEGVVGRGIGKTFTAQSSIRVGKYSNLVKLLLKAGCERLYIGFESISDLVLQRTKKSQTVKEMVESLNILNDFGLKTHGMFVFFGHETADDIKRTVDFAKENRINTAQFLILTPFPGTPVYFDKLSEGSFLNFKWDHFTTLCPVFAPVNMSARKMLLRTLMAHGRFYDLDYMRRHLRKWPDKFASFYLKMGLFAHRVLWPQFFKAMFRELG